MFLEYHGCIPLYNPNIVEFGWLDHATFEWTLGMVYLKKDYYMVIILRIFLKEKGFLKYFLIIITVVVTFKWIHDNTVDKFSVCPGGKWR